MSASAQVKKLEAKLNRLWQLLECADRATNRAASAGRAAEAKVKELTVGLRNIADACSNCITFDELQEMARQALAGETVADREPCDSCALDAAQARVKELEAELAQASTAASAWKESAKTQNEMLDDLQEKLDASRKAWPRRFRAERFIAGARSVANYGLAYQHTVQIGVHEYTTVREAETDDWKIVWIDDPPKESQ